MQAISVKLDKALLKHIDSSLQEFHYSTRTDFIREAIRERLRALRTEEAIARLRQNRGKGKGKRSPLTDERLHEIRENVFREYARKHGRKLQ